MPVEGLKSIDEFIAELDGEKKTEVKAEVAAADEAKATVVADVKEVAEGVEAKVDEAEVEAEAKPVAKPDPQAARFAALSRRERAARQAREEATRKEQALAEREADIKRREDAWNSVKDPIAALQAKGYSYAEATEMMLSGKYTPKEADPVDQKLDARLNPYAEKVSAAEEQINQLKEVIADLQKERIQRSQAEVRNAIMETAKQGGYDFIQAVGDEGYILVQDVIAEHYKKHKRLLNYTEACDRVEAYYEDRFNKLSGTPKVQSRTAQSTVKAPSKQSTSQAAKETSSPRTLTSSLSTSARAKVDVDKLDKNEALEHLATLIRFND